MLRAADHAKALATYETPAATHPPFLVLSGLIWYQSVVRHPAVCTSVVPSLNLVTNSPDMASEWQNMSERIKRYTRDFG